MNSKKRILVLTHELSRTGAPIVLCELLKRLTDSFEFWILTPEDGPLKDDLERIGRVTVLPPAGVEGPWLRRLRHAGIPKRFKQFLLELSNWNPSGIYANSAASLAYVRQLAPLNIPVFLHLHEMEISLVHYGKPFENEIQTAKRIVVVSQAVARSLEQEFGIGGTRVRVIPNFGLIPTSALDKSPRLEFVVGGCGPPGWRKGSSLFLQVANSMGSILPGVPIKFRWLGWRDNLDGLCMREEVEKMNLESVVDLLPPRPDPNAFFRTLSVFALTSWQDPFPLVVLENMALGTPVLAFNGSGGACEALEGCVVPVEHFSPLAMAEAIAHYYLDPDARQRDGDCCCERIRTVYNPEIIIPQFREELLRLGSG